VVNEMAILRISESLTEEIRRHSRESYPYECCGALLGRDEAYGTILPGTTREVVDLFPLINRRDDSPRNRYSVTAEDVRHAEQAAQSRGLDLIGWYHSHPDHPARPSEFDRQHAWPWYSYVIVSVQRGTPQSMTSWRLQDDRAAFYGETVEILNQVVEMDRV